MSLSLSVSVSQWRIRLRRFILGSHFWSIAMKRAIAFLSLFASAAVGFAQQNKDPVTSVVKEILPHQALPTCSCT
jgi:hypothetical protein